MKLFEIPTVLTSLVGLCFLAGPEAPVAQADFTFGEAVNLETAMPFLTTGDSIVECFSSDGLEMFISSTRPGGSGNYDLWVCKRASPEDDWGPPESLGAAVNGANVDAGSSITGDGLELYFFSIRPGGFGNGDVYVVKRATRDSPWGPATNLGAPVNTGYSEFATSVSSDGLELYVVFGPGRGGYGSFDLWVSKRATRNDPWGDPVNLGAAVNSPFTEDCPCLSPDGLLLIFQDLGKPRPGGSGAGDLWMTRRASRSAPWEPPVNLGPTINGPRGTCRACLAPDGSALYFVPATGSVSPHWKAPILPIVDFDGDGKVNEKEMSLLADNWGKYTSLCDIGPFAWGDGVVDEKDLKVFMDSAITPGPSASGVPCDTILSWVAPSFAPICDVYFGTSFEAVSNADRADPCGVLVSQGLMETTYDPEGFLEFEKTYYWRIDFVSDGANPTIYKGAVWRFTAEAAIYPIHNVIATASSFIPSNGPEKTIDGSGLDVNDLHSNDSKDTWWSRVGLSHWIQYQFDKVYQLDELWVWNYNSPIEPSVGFGARTVKIEYSTDGKSWTTLDGVPEFAQAPGQAGYAANTKINFGGVSAKFVKLTITKNWGVTKQTGLSEVRFYAMSAAAAAKP